MDNIRDLIRSLEGAYKSEMSLEDWMNGGACTCLLDDDHQPCPMHRPEVVKWIKGLQPKPEVKP